MVIYQNSVQTAWPKIMTYQNSEDSLAKDCDLSEQCRVWQKIMTYQNSVNSLAKNGDLSE